MFNNDFIKLRSSCGHV